MSTEKRRPSLAKLPAFQPGTKAINYISWESEKFPFHVVIYEYTAQFDVEVFFGSAQIPVWKHTALFDPPTKTREDALLGIEIETAAYLKKAVSELRSWIMNPF